MRHLPHQEQTFGPHAGSPSLGLSVYARLRIGKMWAGTNADVSCLLSGAIIRYSIWAQNLIACALFSASTSAPASWKAGNPDAAAAAARDERIAGALAALNSIDDAAINGDHLAFADLLADDLAVNNPQNGVSVRGATAKRGAGGQISYSRYDRIIDYAGIRGDMVVLMGEEIVLPKGQDATSAGKAHRRFTDLWKPVGEGWKLTARQATIITRP